MKFRVNIILILSVIACILISEETEAQQSYADFPAKARMTVFNDSFDNNTNNWLTDNQWIKGSILNGQYMLTCKNYQNATGLSYKKIIVDQTMDYEIETAIRNIKGTGGLIFGMDNNFNHYRIELAGNKLFLVKNMVDSRKNEILSTININPVSSGSFRKITLRKYKQEFFVFLDESLMGRFNIINPVGDQIGFNVALNSELAIDNLNVSYILEKPVLASAEKVPTQITDTIKTANQTREAVTTLAPANPNGTEINWRSPSSLNTIYDKFSARVNALVRSDTELSSVIFYVNGTPKGEAERRTVAGEPGNYIIEKTINFDPGENVVYFTVTNSKNESEKSEERFFTIPEATKPLVTWAIPAVSNVIVDNERLNIEVCVQSPTELKSIQVLVNGVPMGSSNVFKSTYSDNCNVRWQYPIILREGIDNSIVVIAENIAGSNPSESRVVKYSKAIAQKRIALVLGNSNYNNKTPLKNPVQDANLMEATLEDLGFEVDKRLDLTLQGMRDAVREFSQKMKDYNVALFYYAGHGVQVDGKNFLIPVDARLESMDACKWETFAVNDLMEEFEKNPKNINIAILDACRSNPFQSWVRGDAAGFTPLSNTSGTFVSFATAPGSTAADGSSGNGLFTEELVKQMNIPQPISSVFMNTRINVWERSNHMQRPQEWNDLNGDFYFKK
ncbi:MAG TPA: caspase family protein [Bacteroidales bacterium]|nr:caspase family protein [Bacteroidales bacterium]